MIPAPMAFGMEPLVFRSPALAVAALVLPPVLLALATLLGGRKRSLLPQIVSALAVALLLLAAAGPARETERTVNPVALFAFDVSRSVPAAEIQRALDRAAPLADTLASRGAVVTTLLFDDGVRVLPGPPPRSLDPGEIGARSQTEGRRWTGSRIVPVLLEAQARIPPDAPGRLFLYSDGLFSDAPPPEELPRRFPVFPEPLGPRARTRVAIDAVDLEPPLEEGTPTTAVVELESNAPGEGQVILHRDGARVAAQAVVWKKPGLQRAVFPDLLFPRGTFRLSVAFEGGEGGLPGAGPVRTEIRVEGPPRVLVIDGRPPQGLAILRALEAQGLELSAGEWDEEGPASLEEYDAVVFVEPPPEAAASELPARLARYVRGGGGLVIIAGKTGYGPAYRDTPLASVSPVDPPPPHVEPAEEEPDAAEEEPEPEPPPPSEPPPPPPPPEDEAPPPTEVRTVEVGAVAMVFLIDKSGSMAGKKIRLSKEAAIGAAREIGPGNLLGVLAFDTEASWLVPMVPSDERDLIVDRVSRLQAGGGTNIFPALVKAYNALKDLPARIKHVILISDGYNKTLEDFKGIVDKMREASITLSTIGVGEQFDTRLLSSLTYWAGRETGRFDFTRDFSRIPRLVVEQTRWVLGKPETPEDEPAAPETEPPALPETPPPPAPQPAPPPPEDTPPPPEASREPPERVPLQLIPTHPSPPFRGIAEEALPPLFGFRKSEPGPLADVLARGPGGETVMAVGEVGLGKVFYAGTDFGEGWGEEWRSWEAFPKWMGQLVRWIKRRPENPLPPRITFEPLETGAFEVIVASDPAIVAPEEAPEVTVAQEGRAPAALPVLRAGTHRFTARLEAGSFRPGAVLRVAFPPGSGARGQAAEAQIPRPVDPERSRAEPDLEVLERMARAGRGRIGPASAEAEDLPAGRRSARDPLHAWLLLAAAVLLPAAALFRRRRK